MSTDNLKIRIMRRVYLTRSLRRVTSPTAIKTYTLVFLSGALINEVSLTDVFSNAPKDITLVVGFAARALANTEQMVQIFLIIATVCGSWLIVDIARPIFKSTKTTSQKGNLAVSR